MSNKKFLITTRLIGYFLLLSIFLQIILGAWVRLTGSGMSCPDWPLCYGFLFPTPEKIDTIDNVSYTYLQIFLEWIHRANAAFIIGPVCLIFSLYLIIKKESSKLFHKLAYILLLLIIIQGGLGGLTVFKSNIPWSVAIHLMFAFLLYLTTLVIIIKTYNIRNNIINANKSLRLNTLVVGILTMSAAALGAFTSKYGASLSCNNWPGCTEGFLPNIKDIFQLIHFSHRIIALLLVISLILLFIKFRKYLSIVSVQVKVILSMIFSIIILQVAVGALLIYMEVPIWMGIFHQATGLLLFTLITILYLFMNIGQNNKLNTI